MAAEVPRYASADRPKLNRHADRIAPPVPMSPATNPDDAPPASSSDLRGSRNGRGDATAAATYATRNAPRHSFTTADDRLAAPAAPAKLQTMPLATNSRQAVQWIHRPKKIRRDALPKR